MLILYVILSCLYAILYVDIKIKANTAIACNKHLQMFKPKTWLP